MEGAGRRLGIPKSILSRGVLVPAAPGAAPPRQAGYMEELPGIGGVWHGSLLITLPRVPRGGAKRLLFIRFISDEHMLG